MFPDFQYDKQLAQSTTIAFTNLFRIEVNSGSAAHRPAKSSSTFYYICRNAILPVYSIFTTR
jgi:hypothetical protein